MISLPFRIAAKMFHSGKPSTPKDQRIFPHVRLMWSNKDYSSTLLITWVHLSTLVILSVLKCSIWSTHEDDQRSWYRYAAGCRKISHWLLHRSEYLHKNRKKTYQKWNQDFRVCVVQLAEEANWRSGFTFPVWFLTLQQSFQTTLSAHVKIHEWSTACKY